MVERASIKRRITVFVLFVLVIEALAALLSLGSDLPLHICLLAPWLMAGAMLFLMLGALGVLGVVAFTVLVLEYVFTGEWND